MGLKAIGTAITDKLGPQILTIRKHSPGLLFGAGVVGIVGTVVLASRATLKVEEVLDQHEKRMQDIQKAHVLDPEVYQEHNVAQDTALTYVKTAVSLGKLYAPAIVVGAASIAALTGSHYILTNRVAGLTAAYAALDKGFRAYRQRVIDELGPQKDAEFRFGVEEHEIIEETEEGPVIKTIKTPKDGRSIYARCFDETNPSWEKGPGLNQFFIQCQQNYANDRLKARGYMFLNEVYEMLGFPKTEEGCVVGWLRDGDGDGYIDFGIFNNEEFTITRFLNGYERSIWLDFNVDGPIHTKFARI